MNLYAVTVSFPDLEHAEFVEASNITDAILIASEELKVEIEQIIQVELVAERVLRGKSDIRDS